MSVVGQDSHQRLPEPNSLGCINHQNYWSMETHSDLAILVFLPLSSPLPPETCTCVLVRMRTHTHSHTHTPPTPPHSILWQAPGSSEAVGRPSGSGEGFQGWLQWMEISAQSVPYLD